MKTSKKITQEEFESVLRYVFDIPEDEAISPDTDLSKYIQDSIDLGELLAVIKDKYGIAPESTEPFRHHTTLIDVLKIINNEDIS